MARVEQKGNIRSDSRMLCTKQGLTEGEQFPPTCFRIACLAEDGETSWDPMVVRGSSRM